MLDVYEYFGAPVLALMEVPKESISAYGVVAGRAGVSQRYPRPAVSASTIWSKSPSRSEAPSNLAIIGRYVLTPEIFTSLEAINPGAGGEIQLTDGLRYLLRNRPIYGFRFEGTRYDAGDKLGFLKATVEFALKRQDLGGQFRAVFEGTHPVRT